MYGLTAKLIVCIADLGQDAHFELAHREEQLRIVFAVDADHGIVPLNRSKRSRDAILDVPVHG